MTRVVAVLPIIALGISGCGGGGGNDFEGAICGGLRDISSSRDAEIVAEEIAASVEAALNSLSSNATYSNESVLGTNSGSVLITGSLSSANNVSCGSDCIRSSSSSSVVAEFSNFSRFDNTGKISGSVVFNSSRSSTQSGLSFFSSSNVSVSDNGSSITFDSGFSDPLCAEPLVGIRSTILSMGSSGSSASSQSGSITNSAGTTSF